jgi:hypothetical protein
MNPSESSVTEVRIEDLVAVLGASLGDDKARETLTEAVRTLGLDPARMSREQALSVLEHLTETPGIVGVTSRFGRSRLMLQWARDNLRSLRPGR